MPHTELLAWLIFAEAQPEKKTLPSKANCELKLNKRNIMNMSYRITTLIKVFRFMAKYEVHCLMQSKVIKCKFK